MGWLLQSAVLGFMYVCIVFCCCYFCILSGPGSSAKLARAVKDRQSPTVGPGKDFQKKTDSWHFCHPGPNIGLLSQLCAISECVRGAWVVY